MSDLRRGSWIWRAAALVWMASMFWLSSRSDLPGVGTIPEWLPVDKVGHFGLFAILAALIYLAGLRVPLAIAIAALYGVSDEVHQAFVPGRSPDVRDWFADLAGATVGSWLVSLPERRSRGRREPIE